MAAEQCPATLPPSLPPNFPCKQRTDGPAHSSVWGRNAREPCGGWTLARLLWHREATLLRHGPSLSRKASHPYAQYTHTAILGRFPSLNAQRDATLEQT